MTDFAALLSQGTTSAWLFIPSAILLGALHGLEPGHSKTMMAAFIVAIRGTVKQAVMLGLAATLVGVGAAAALSVQKATQRWQGLDTLARRAPWFSGTLIALVAIYMGYHGLSGILH
ncbi:hypothetical protein LV651_004772 [Escherichia coli]|uniref:HoxN/HupN/NixA family nickel/cobalt transporter n=1 Tax=Escherichia coli TaxID=562 RepID=UPI000BDE5D87|nr:hypothetical protein [Escherichia coli]EFA6884711.1 hypothetical protein [Escherichia coli]EFC1809867.1 hypothetical protein [Escherichia coli]EFC6742164.1 hypothetical protein [Escherichia coli]EGO4366193.1 hypothetical protein [Escherichia coli]